MRNFRILAPAGCLVSLLLSCGTARAEDDKFADCPDPQAALQYVKQCLATNPYKTKEACEELAREALCKKK
jgi:hypothetical protein